MKKNVTTLTNDCQKFLIETVRQLEKLISTTESEHQEGESKREGTLLFPSGIGYVSLKVTIQSVGEASLTISGEHAAKPASKTGGE